MRLTASRIGAILLILTFITSQAVSYAAAFNAPASGKPSGGGAASIQAVVAPVPFVDPPWVAQTVGRKPWQWPCDWNSPFNLPLATTATYDILPAAVTSFWTSQLPIYNASTSDPAGIFYIRDGSGQLQEPFNSTTTARSNLLASTQLALVNSSHQTPDQQDQIHTTLTTHATGNPFDNYRPIRTNWTSPFYLPTQAAPLDKTAGNPDGLISIFQPNGTVVEANGGVRLDRGLVAAYGSVIDAKGSCTFEQNGVRSGRLLTFIHHARVGDVRNALH
ncbi:MAG: hypothetical protein ABI947_29545 [Chloroflexota bacterium]